MPAVRIFHDREGQTLTVWFDEPSDEYVCEETGSEIVLMKNRAGRVIGIEKLNFSVPEIRILEGRSRARDDLKKT